MVAPPPASPPRRVAFLGTPETATHPLRAIHDAGIEVPLVVTQPDARRGRGRATSPSPVKATAEELGLAVSHDVDDLLPLAAAGGLDLAVVVAFGRIIRPHVLDVVPMVNLHFSLLPRWRGAAPVERAILAGDPTTGVSVMEVDEGLDTGAVYRWVEVPIGLTETAGALRARLVHLGTGLLLEALLDGLGEAVPQEGEPSYAEKLAPADLRVVWDGSAVAADRQVRVGGAWTTFRGKRLKVLGAVRRDDPAAGPPGSLEGCVVACGDGALELVEVQPEGRGPVEAAAWVRGARPLPGEALGS